MAFVCVSVVVPAAETAVMASIISDTIIQMIFVFIFTYPLNFLSHSVCVFKCISKYKFLLIGYAMVDKTRKVFIFSELGYLVRRNVSNNEVSSSS